MACATRITRSRPSEPTFLRRWNKAGASLEVYWGLYPETGKSPNGTALKIHRVREARGTQ